eukprot:356968-Chlamydomonas_euryale.AAC.5
MTQIGMLRERTRVCNPWLFEMVVWNACMLQSGSVVFGTMRAVKASFRLTYAACSDEGLFEDEILKARQQKEAASLATWKKNFLGLSSCSFTACDPMCARFSDSATAGLVPAVDRSGYVICMDGYTRRTSAMQCHDSRSLTR